MTVSAALRLLLALALPLMLAACVTVPPPTMPVAELQSFKLAGVEVQGTQVIQSWPAMEQAYLASGKADADTARRLPSENAQNFPAVEAQFQAALQQRFAADLEGQVGALLQGTRPVKAVVQIQVFDVPSSARGGLVDNTAKLKANIDLVDAKSGAVLVSYAGPMKTLTLGPSALTFVAGGFAAVAAQAMLATAVKGEPGSQLVATYVQDYRTWLVTR